MIQFPTKLSYTYHRQRNLVFACAPQGMGTEKIAPGLSLCMKSYLTTKQICLNHGKLRRLTSEGEIQWNI